jgi:hypothetical protein
MTQSTMIAIKCSTLSPETSLPPEWLGFSQHNFY